jgi:hypothetical protein
MVLSGERGAGGEGFNFRGEWQTDTFYSKNDVVTQNGSSYIANYDYQDNDGPFLDGDLWAIFALKGTDGTGGSESPKTWNASNEVQYSIHQAHGGIEVTTEEEQYATYTAIGYGNQNNSTSFPLVISDANLNDMLTAITNGSLHLRKITILVGGVERIITPNYSPGPNPQGWTWYFTSISPINIFDLNTYALNITYGSPPVIWWDAADLGFDMNDDDFRGAKIEYHAFVPDGGTMIGTIYIASDSGDALVTHIETGSGGSDLGTASWWYRKNGWQEEERRLYFYRTDGEANTHKIQWTAQVYYASEYRD